MSEYESGQFKAWTPTTAYVEGEVIKAHLGGRVLLLKVGGYPLTRGRKRARARRKKPA